MKRITIYLFILLVGLSVKSLAQDNSTILNITDTKVKFIGDSLQISFNANYKANGKLIRSGEALHIKPIYVVDKKEYPFAEMLINGKARAPYYKREQNMMSHEEYIQQKPYRVVVYVPTKGLQLHYDATMPLDKSISREGTLHITQYVEDCCDMRQRDIMQIALAKKPLPPFTPERGQVSFYEPQKEDNKVRSEELTLSLNFIVNKYDILPNYMQNARELKLVEDLSKILSADDTYAITKTEIEGYASPEAPYDYNLKLSDQRANSMKNYIKTNYSPFAKVNIQAVGKGEDWTTFEKLVNGHTTMPQKTEVLKIINNTSSYDQKDEQLKAINNGTVYNYMLKEIFPQLRTTKVRVAYKVRAFTPEEVSKIIQTRPQDLSQREIYLHIQDRYKGFDLEHKREQFGREYDLAYKYFSNDPTACINAAGAALLRHQPDLAEQYLKTVKELPEAANNMGIYYWMKGDLEKAQQYFEKGAKSGDKLAKSNLDKITQIIESR